VLRRLGFAALLAGVVLLAGAAPDTLESRLYDAAISPGGDVSTSLARQLDVFSRHRTTADDLPQSVRESFEENEANPFLTHSKPLLEESRRIIQNFGSLGWNMYLVPTSKGSVCQVISASRSGHEMRTCDDTLYKGFTANTYRSVDGHRIIFGLVENDILAARVVFGRVEYPMELRENGFVAELPEKVGQARIDPEALVVSRGRGNTETIPIPEGMILDITTDG
jgi:hypothetical protein